jgi:DNA polymerase I-like protein with 3'-5' exonuclease and polymerase domains
MNILQGIEHLHTLDGASFVAFDVETTGLQPKFGGLRLLQLATVDQSPVVLDCWQFSDEDWITLENFFTKERTWLAHNAVFDLGWLQEHEIYPEGLVFCSMLASRILTNGLPNQKHGLKHVVNDYLDYDISKDEQKSDWSGDLTLSQLEYAATDVVVLTELYDVLQELMAKYKPSLQPAWRLECKALPAMAQLWRTGLPFNKSALVKLIEELDIENFEIGEQFIEDFDAALPPLAKLVRNEQGKILYQVKPGAKGTKPDKRVFNLNSPIQLLNKFTALLGAEPLDPKTGKASASKAALQEYVGEHKIIADYLRWKRVEKRRQMAETLLKNLSGDGFIRASYLQMGADTGRMSCMSPNLQQVPRDVRFRACVQAPTGWRLVVADYGQMELRLAAAEAQDPLMTQVFQQGKDLHTITATQIYGVKEEDVTKEQRQVSKSANFGLLYGSGAKGLRNYAATMGIQMDLNEATAVREKFHAAYTGISEWQQRNALAAHADSYNASIRIRESGLRRFLPGENNKLTTRCNTPIQGAGAAVLKLTLGKLWPFLKADGEERVRLAGVVHDEIILLVKEEHADVWAAQLQAIMEEAEAKWLGDIPPLAEAKVGLSWDQAK